MALLDEMPLSTSAYLADTQHLSLSQHGAYLLILMTMWRSGGWIDDDDKKLAIICKLSPAKWVRIATEVRKLLLSQDGKLSQKRLLVEVEKKLNRDSKNRSNGSLGGKAKALKNQEPPVANATISVETEPSAIPIGNLFKDSEIPEKKKERIGRRQPRSLPPKDWRPTDEGMVFARERGFAGEPVEAMIRGFVRYYLGRGKTLANFELAWENWVDNEVKFRGRGRADAGGSGRNGRLTFSDIAMGGTENAETH